MLDLRFEKNRRKLFGFVTAFSFLLFVSITTAQAQSTETFANFTQLVGSQNAFVFTKTSSTTGTFVTTRLVGGMPVNNVNINFNYVSGIDPDTGLPFGIVGLPTELQGTQAAKLSLTSSTSSAVSPAFNDGGNVIQPLTGTTTISITRNTPASTGGGARTNLLTVVITTNTSPARINGPGGSGSFAATTPDQNVTFTSDFLDFTQTNARNTSITSTGIDPPLFLPAGETIINNFSAPFLGSFASNPIPTYNPPTAASVNIGGRVMNAAGRGINRALVSFIDGNGETRTASTNIFGYYRFEGVQAGQTIVVSVASKRYIFASQLVSVATELTNLNFTALE